MQKMLAEGRSFALVTVIDTFGSTPCPAGARMIAGSEGRVFGTIGGAEAEYLAIEDAKLLIARRGGSFVRNYRLGPDGDDAAPLDAQCGGEITVFSRYIGAETPGLREFVETGLRRVCEKDGTWLLMEVAADAEDAAALCIASENGIIASVGGAPEDVAALTQRVALQAEQNGRRWFSLPLTTSGFVYIFGGGHVAQELVPLLCRLGFRCVVFDDREAYTAPDLFPGAAKIIRGDFSRVENSLSLESPDYAVIVTRGHRWDFQVMAFALRSNAAYIGVIGSAAKHAFVRERLLEAGFTPAQIAAPRVHAPIGVSIGSKTPAEVAVSIAAELIQIRAIDRR